MATLKTRYKLHTKRGTSRKEKMLVVDCPQCGKTIGVQNVCISEGIKCYHFVKLDRGWVICNYPLRLK